MSLHKDATEANLHETKGVSTATDGQQLHAASGVGQWLYERIYLQIELDDISTASSSYVVVPKALTVDKIKTVLHGVITGVDAGLLFKINGTTITNGDITIAQSGSAARDVDVSSPTALNIASENDVIEVVTDGASTNVVRLSVMLVCQRTA